MQPAAGTQPQDAGSSARRAVEHLLRTRLSGPDPRWQDRDPQPLYQAACRFVMRLVVVLFAEARALLPADDPLYDEQYGLRSLIRILKQKGPSARAAEAAAWPRLLRLFRLLHAGSSDPRLAIPAHGGELFRGGDPHGDASARAMALLESAEPPPCDEAVHGLLAQLCQTDARARAGQRPSSAELDFSALPSEYLGFFYEGLLAHPPVPLVPPVATAVGQVRKGQGSFYTPVALTLPVVRLTLQPLLQDAQGQLRSVEQLLALKVCDPAMGCGAFLLAALRVLAEAVGRAAPGARQVLATVAAKCLHGVDVDPLAVELARLSLWLETREPSVPWTFVDHKLRCGDALIGAFGEQLHSYPLDAWDRQRPSEGKSRRGASEASSPWADPLRRLRAEVRAELKALRPGEPSFAVDPGGPRRAHDAYCALWFWPLDRLHDAPRPAHLRALPQAAVEVCATLARTRRFFHWELEFPEVFATSAAGFDAIVGNPPWEIRKPSSQEFFSALDPSYRSYGKQQALARQRELFAADARVRQRWLDYAAAFQDTARFIRHAFHYQGSSDPNSYKLFIEQAHRLLRPGGQLGLVTPSGLYSDQGSRELRRLLLTRCAWRLLYGFQNERHVFRGVHHAFKQCVIIAQKTAPDGKLEVMFRLGVAESPAPHELPLHLGPAWQPIRYPLERTETLSPQSLSILELRSPRDLEVLTKIYAGSTLLGEQGPRSFKVRYASGLHLTSDSHLFVPRQQAAAAGYQPDSYGRWRGPQGDVLLPLYQGVMFYCLSPSVAQYRQGAGHRARWTRTEHPGAPLSPQFLLPAAVHGQRQSQRGAGGTKVAFRALSNATNERTLIACLLPELPCGNSVGVLSVGDGDLVSHAFATACLGSLVYDYTLRQRIGGTNINFCFLQETGWPADGLRAAPWLLRVVLGLCAPAWRYAPLWRQALPHVPRVRWAQTPHERLRLRCNLDAAIAALYGLSSEDLRYILRGCDAPAAQLADAKFYRTLDPKGFWRVDKAEDPELRHTVLTQLAFAALQELIAQHHGDRAAAVAAFLSLQDGEGWMLPAQLCLAEHGLGQDARAQLPQPVQARLGPRLLDWQQTQTREQSFAECERHARAMEGY